MKPIAVSRWVDWNDAGKLIDAGARDIGVGYAGGGWFGFSNGVRYADSWDDYLASLPEQQRPHILGLRDAIVSSQSKASSDRHQNADHVPVFEDGSVARFGSRAWGDLMAAVWSAEENTTYCYLDFYATLDEIPERPAVPVTQKRSSPVGLPSGGQFMAAVLADIRKGTDQ